MGSGLFGEKLRDIFCNGGRSGKTRRFYTRNIDKAVVFIGIAYYKVIRNRMRSDTCKRCYCASDIYVRNGFQSLRENKLKALGSCIHIVLIILIRRRRADKKVAVNRRSYQYALAHFVGALEYGAVNKMAEGFIEKIILAFTGYYLYGIVYHTGNLVAVSTCGIYYI